MRIVFGPGEADRLIERPRFDGGGTGPAIFQLREAREERDDERRMIGEADLGRLGKCSARPAELT